MPNYRRSQVSGATYFFTVTLADRRAFTLVDRIVDLRRAYAQTSGERPFTTDAICVLPDHLHAIWTLPEGDSDYSTRWNLIKGRLSRCMAAASARSGSAQSRREKGIWQRRFWEHRIRDEIDYARHVDYIHFNPVKHGHVSRVSDWPHSSFHRFVRRGLLDLDWGGQCAAGLEDGYGE